jgi:adenylosuccinate synthase
MIDVVVGGQFGSEGKGAVVGQIAKNYDTHVRVGASNAGHTVYVNGHKHVVQAIPCAAYANPEATCVIGAGALISTDILVQEIKINNEWRKRNGYRPLQLWIDERAHVITDCQIAKEQESDLASRIGSTSTIAKEGIGAAAADRVMRSIDCVQAGEMKDALETEGVTRVGDTIGLFAAISDPGGGLESNILLEGTQGTGLSLTTGDFPYVTSRNPTAAGIAADCGIGPKAISNVFLVLRTYPIRVAGNSGPFGPGSQEISFEDLGVPEERTTVTKLVRRIATFSGIQAQEAAFINSANKIALTFGDYIAKNLAGRSDITHNDYKINPSGVGILTSMVHYLEEVTGAEVTHVGTGPQSMISMADYRNVFADALYQHKERYRESV